jgi:hypothetical protein
MEQVLLKSQAKKLGKEAITQGLVIWIKQDQLKGRRQGPDLRGVGGDMAQGTESTGNLEAHGSVWSLGPAGRWHMRSTEGTVGRTLALCEVRLGCQVTAPGQPPTVGRNLLAVLTP